MDSDSGPQFVKSGSGDAAPTSPANKRTVSANWFVFAAVGFAVMTIVAVSALAGTESSKAGGETEFKKSAATEVPTTTTSTSTTTPTTAAPVTSAPTTTAAPLQPEATNPLSSAFGGAKDSKPSGPWANCTEARNAGVTPIRAGEPGYASKLDRDGDGIACE